MKKRQVLLLENESSLAAAIASRLARIGQFTIDVVSTGYGALRALGTAVPDALVVDTTLPDMPATELCRAIRSRERTAHVPLMLVSEPAVLGPIIGFELGADDYVTKPFDPEELAARLKALLRRQPIYEPERQADVFKGELLEADFNAVDVLVRGRPVTLTKREFRLLRHLVHMRNQVMDRAMLLASVWGGQQYDPRLVDAAIWRLRTKLDEAGRQIETVPGFGYRFNEPPER